MIGRVEKIYFANGVKMKMSKDADGNVRTEVLGDVKPEPVKQIPVVEFKSEPVIEPVKVEIVVPEVEANEEQVQVQSEGSEEGQSEECASSDEQRGARGRRKLSR